MKNLHMKIDCSWKIVKIWGTYENYTWKIYTWKFVKNEGLKIFFENIKKTLTWLIIFILEKDGKW